MSAPAPDRPILIIGGYGGFGSRLSRRLADRGYRLIIAGRSAERARAFAATLDGAEAMALDTRAADLAGRLAASGAAVVIDAAGPFQQAEPLVARAALAAGIDYCDLADARDFVCTIGMLDAQAKARGVAILSGASSVPALSGAVMRQLASGMQRVAAVDIVISASNRGGAGKSVARAMLSYAGQRFAVWRGGRVDALTGWLGLTRRHITMNGNQALGRRWLADADVPDLALLPDRLPGRPSVRFRAGTDRAVQVFGLALVALAVRWRLIRSGSAIAALLSPLQRLTGICSSKWSGMQVRLTGDTGHGAIERQWTLLVGGGRGPEVPPLAAALLVERMLGGTVEPGARDAGEALTLDAFDAAFDALGALRQMSERPLPPPLYRRVLGEGFDRLPASLQAMHAIIGTGGAAGRGRVERGRHPLARLIAWVMRFPPAGDHPLHVVFETDDDGEVWTRDFGGHRFHSRLSMRSGQLTERFGPMCFAFDLPADADGLAMHISSWRAFGIPMPLWLAPRIAAREWEEQRRFQFEVAIAMPLIGPVIHYRGWLDCVP